MIKGNYGQSYQQSINEIFATRLHEQQGFENFTHYYPVTMSFIEKEIRLLQYVRDRHCVDIDKAEMDFSIYEADLTERHIRIPKLKALYERKMLSLKRFQSGKDIWHY